jgi:hypothetical protein
MAGPDRVRQCHTHKYGDHATRVTR